MRRYSAIPLAFIIACAATPGVPEVPEEPLPPGTGESPAPAETASPVASAAPTSPPTEPDTEAPPPSKEPAEPTACPGGMKLVDGDYCTEVKQTCNKSWFDKSNKKKVCEEFTPPSVCVGNKVKKRFCIDTYAWPNKSGERPEVMNNYYQAQVKCAAIGKRLCTESEWTFACEGPEMKPFPHGYVRDARKCNGDHRWDSPDMKRVGYRNAREIGRLWHGVRSGSQPECVSDFGVADLPGNNDEVVSSETFTKNWRGKFDSVHTGGPWYKGVRNQCRPKIYTHNEGFYYYFLGFRCCAEADGKETDPRTPKQKKKEWRFESAERLAGFTREDVRNMLETKKEKGHCDCKPCPGNRRCPRSALICNTLCGTTMGDNAKDADGSHLPASE